MDRKRKIKCAGCKGKGKVYRPAERSCPKCGGTGWVYVGGVAVFFKPHSH